MKVVVELKVSAGDYLAHYQGIARAVVTTDIHGKSVRFPSGILRPFVSHNGIRGTFEITFDANNKFKNIRKL